MKNYMILLASGSGSRFGSKIPKQFQKINKKMILEHTLDALDGIDQIDKFIIVVPPKYKKFITHKLNQRANHIKYSIVDGGESRQKSCENAVKTIDCKEAKVLVHNAVQPLISEKNVLNCLDALNFCPCCTSVIPCTYTILEEDSNHYLRNTVPRNSSVCDLGPEGFLLSLLKKALNIARQDDTFTNLTGIVFKNNLSRVYLVDSEQTNIKITYPSDISLMRSLLKKRNKNSLHT
jgi:2-C-methyl-D-erythritol 4-phosphate cytidylyltransferase